MNYAFQIQTELAQLARLGYTDTDLSRIVEQYSGYPAWMMLSRNQQRRLSEDLRRHVQIARRWNYLIKGYV